MRFGPFAVAAIVSLAALLAASDRAQARSEEATIKAAGDVLNEFLNLRMKDIPESLLAKSEGVAIIPDVIKVGLVLGGQRGHGVVIFREKDGTWRAPTFITLTGGSIGWQAGAQSSDIVLVFKTQKSVEGLMRGKFTLGADAAVAAGPVGRRAAAATDGELKAEIYSYSRSRGLFAGVSIDGSVLNIDDSANAAYYGRADAAGNFPPPPEAALQLVGLVARLTTISDPAAAAAPSPLQPAGTLVQPQPEPDLGPSLGVPQNAIPTPARPLSAIPTPADPNLRPAADTEALRGELARAAEELSPLLDEPWKRYLAIPVEVYRGGRPPAAAALTNSVRRFDSVASNAQYRALNSRPEFQATRDLLRAYADTLAAQGEPKLALPPPPLDPR